MMSGMNPLHIRAAKRWYPLIPHPVQTALVNDGVRFKVVPAGRRSGKTERAKRFVVREAMRNRGKPYFFAAPTRDQVKRIYWNDAKLLSLTPALGDRCVSESELVIRLPNESSISLIGLDQPQRMEGVFWAGGVVDEIADVKPTAWAENISPALDTYDPANPGYRAWCWLIGVPDGCNHYFDMAEYARTSGDPDWKLYTWKSADVLPPDVIESAKRRMSKRQFEQEYEAAFVNFEGRAYYAFDAAIHTTSKGLPYDPKAPLIFCFDFNVDPGVAAICQELPHPKGGASTGVIGEVYIEQNSNTPAVCRKLIQDWGDHKGRIKCYGDATGGARGTAKVMGSDWDLIKSTLGPHFGDRVTYHVDSSNPPEKVRLNAVNSRLANAAGDIRLIVDRQRAPRVIKDFEGVMLLKGGSGEIDKLVNRALTHLTDGIGYYIAKEFPIISQGIEFGAFSGH